MGNFTRGRKGGSLVETLVVTTIMSLVAAGSLSLLIAQGKVSKRFGTKMDAVNAERIALERLGKDVRQARSLGDVFGGYQTVTAAGVEYEIIEGVDYFPATADPMYSNQAPPNGWPSGSGWAPDSGVPAPGRWKLGPQTLIVQVPIFDAVGFPSGLAKGAIDPARPTPDKPCANVETHIYRVVPSDVAGEWQLEFLQLPGFNQPGYTGTQKGPQVILKGIVGPTNAQGNVTVFQYLDRTGNGKPVSTIPNPKLVANYTGVVANIEVRRMDGRDQAVLGFKTELFLRNNALATETATAQ